MSETIDLENEAEKLRVAGNYDEAAEKLPKALEIYPDFARAHLALAVTYFLLKDAEKMCHPGERAIEV